jgi:tRNA nucleotidyltransferase (CCA-adding enzyme)
MNGYWSHFPHGADLGVRGVGATREEAFEQAALALSAAIADLSTIKPETAVGIACKGQDDRLLLVAWLNALIYEMAVRKMLFSRFKLTIDGQHLQGEAWGQRIDPARHDLGVEPKGATYTAVAVEQNADGTWHAQCVVDV